MRSDDKDSLIRSNAKATTLRAATPNESVSRLRDGLAPARGGLGSLASIPKRASDRPTATRATKSPTKKNRPPEAWRAENSEMGASAGRLGSSLHAAEAVSRTVESPGRASVRLGANRPEARASRMLSGAGLFVDARAVMERSGLGPALACALLDFALTSVRERSDRRLRATLYELPRRPWKDDPLS